jgi:hypothetical protein
MPKTESSSPLSQLAFLKNFNPDKKQTKGSSDLSPDRTTLMPFQMANLLNEEVRSPTVNPP